MSAVKRWSLGWCSAAGVMLAVGAADAADGRTVTRILGDDFETGYALGLPWQEKQSYGAWSDQWNGLGSTGVVPDPTRPWEDYAVLAEQPEAATARAETHSALVTSRAAYGDLRFGAKVRTAQQLRQGSAPNPWEVAWVLWHYTDSDHFYYFIPKPDGWELGKEDPAYPGNQRFLAGGAAQTFPAGAWYAVQVEQAGSQLTVSVDGAPIVQITDGERPYLRGTLGLYTEDAAVHFNDVSVAF